MSRNSNGTKWCLLTRHTRTIHDKEDLIALHSFISNGSEQVAQSQALKACSSTLPIRMAAPKSLLVHVRRRTATVLSVW